MVLELVSSTDVGCIGGKLRADADVLGRSLKVFDLLVLR